MGMSFADAALAEGVKVPTAKTWLARGRREGSGDYFEFAQAIDRARVEARTLPEPMGCDELLRVMSNFARNGSVQAGKLVWEILTTGEQPAEDEPANPLAEIDELARRRRAG
jgi:hypothetical protein